MSNSKDQGGETEARIISQFVANGYSVSIPFGDNDKYDLPVDDGTRLYRVQCKTAWQNKPQTIRFNTHSQTTKNGSYYEQTYDDTVDAFRVRYPETDRLYWIPIDEATKQKMELRFESSVDQPSINWATDYEFDGQIPE